MNFMFEGQELYFMSDRIYCLDFHSHAEIAYRGFTRNVPRAELIFVYFQY